MTMSKLDNLEEATEYSIIVTATLSNSQSQYINVMQMIIFTVPSEPPSYVKVCSVESSVINLEWGLV